MKRGPSSSVPVAPQGPPRPQSDSGLRPGSSPLQLIPLQSCGAALPQAAQGAEQVRPVATTRTGSVFGLSHLGWATWSFTPDSGRVNLWDSPKELPTGTEPGAPGVGEQAQRGQAQRLQSHSRNTSPGLPRTCASPATLWAGCSARGSPPGAEALAELGSRGPMGLLPALAVGSEGRRPRS